MRSKENIEFKKVSSDAKELCCEIVGAQDFAFISKVQLALVVRNLVLDVHKKKEMLDTAMVRVKELETKYEPKEGGQG